MAKSIHKKIGKRINSFIDIRNRIIAGEYDLYPDRDILYEDLGEDSSDGLLIDFDDFKNKYPERYKYYFNEFWYEFGDIVDTIKNQISLLDGDTENFKKLEYLTHLGQYAEIIYNYIDEQIPSEDERLGLIPSEPHHKFERLQPIEKILILNYLDFKVLNPQYSISEKEYILSRLFGINKNSINNPLSKVNEYTEFGRNRITNKQAEQFFQTLQKVKLFFDESKRFEISKVVEKRIEVLKEIAGKV